MRGKKRRPRLTRPFGLECPSTVRFSAHLHNPTITVAKVVGAAQQMFACVFVWAKCGGKRLARAKLRKRWRAARGQFYVAAKAATHKALSDIILLLDSRQLQSLVNDRRGVLLHGKATRYSN